MAIAPEYLHLVYPDRAPFGAFLYGRNSADPKKKGRSVSDQLMNGRALCEAHDWPVLHEFKDTGISASRHARKARDEFDEMLQRIEAGEPRILVAWEASRYYRDLEIYVRLRNACFAANVLLCYNGTVYDLSKRADRKATAMDAIAAEDEAEGIRDRNVRTLNGNAAKGRPHGPVLTGYRRVYDQSTGELLNQEPHARQAKFVNDLFELAEKGTGANEIARKVAEQTQAQRTRLERKGRSEEEITQTLIELGLLTRFGNPWRAKAITKMLTNKAFLGKKINNGEETGTATWKAIVPEDRFYAVQRIIEQRRYGKSHDTSVKHLLSGIPVCGEHGDQDPLVRWKKDGKGHEQYRCVRTDVTLSAARFQAYVEEGVVTWLSSAEAKRAFEQSAQSDTIKRARRKLTGMEHQLREARAAAREFDDDGQPRMSALTLADLERGLSPQMKKLKGQIEAATIPPILRGLVGNRDADRIWASLEMATQRMILREVVTIRVFKAPAQGVKSLEGRVRMSFFGEPGFKPVDGSRA
ncbi:recombinase family protein [Streptomyces sp. MNU76]|uniref:recombinase family protein n=1 Tax=Streptomyces sp. MNU76 TaxID=2560026 RepID=UPI001E3AA33F|nr:recombinase family protein [Streptomyces sp. MNU76]MCC9712036.1 recombinase family protein [Streptomyces sp. MNU76]